MCMQQKCLIQSVEGASKVHKICNTYRTQHYDMYMYMITTHLKMCTLTVCKPPELHVCPTLCHTQCPTACQHKFPLFPLFDLIRPPNVSGLENSLLELVYIAQYPIISDALHELENLMMEIFIFVCFNFWYLS